MCYNLTSEFFNQSKTSVVKSIISGKNKFTTSPVMDDIAIQGGATCRLTPCLHEKRLDKNKYK